MWTQPWPMTIFTSVCLWGTAIRVSGNGHVIETLDIGNVSDDMTYDSAHHRIYVSSEDGVDVVAQDSPDHYHVVQHGGRSRYSTKTYQDPIVSLQIIVTEIN
jgi:hypothetical protein